MRIPKWDCIPPLETPCSLGSYIQRELLGDFKFRAGTAVPLPTFAENPQKFPQTPGASLDSVRPRSLLLRVCRNLSCKLLSHPLAALTGLCGVPPHELRVNNIVLQNWIVLPPLFFCIRCCNSSDRRLFFRLLCCRNLRLRDWYRRAIR